MKEKELRKLLKEAFEAGRDYQWEADRPNLDLKESYPSFTKWYNNKTEKHQFLSTNSELLEAYTQFLWTQHNNLTDADNNKLALEKFIASYCG